MKFMKRAFGEFNKFHMKWPSVRFCLSYDPLNLDFIAFKRKNISIRKRMVDTDVVNDVTYARQYDITRAVIRFL